MLRLFVLQPAFLIVSLILASGALGLAISLPRIWVRSPPNTIPVVRASLLDLVQAASLRRSASRLAESGNNHEAARAWQGAVANDPANPGLLREALQHFIRIPDPDTPLARQAVVECAALLRWGRTNHADIELVAVIWDRYGLAKETYDLLEPIRNTLGLQHRRIYLRTAFVTGRMDEFGKRWAEWGTALDDDDEFSLYAAAYEAGWGPPEAAARGRARLAEAARRQESASLASRLELALYSKTTEASPYRQALQRLEAVGADRLADRIGYWRLLDRTGQRAEARRLATEDIGILRWPWEILQLCEALVALDLKDQAIALLRKQTPIYAHGGGPWALAMWMAQCDLLIDSADWNGLSDLATRMTASETTLFQLDGFAHFIEGRAQIGLGHAARALDAFRKAVTRDFPTPEVTLEAARLLCSLGHPDLARDLLLRVERDLGGDIRYWRVVLDVADTLRQDSLWLLKAASQGRRLAPQDPLWQASYAVGLVFNRQSPAEAIPLTLQLAHDNPTRIEYQVHHALALVQNRRYDEADRVLRAIPLNRLNDLGRTLYGLAELELRWEQHDPEAARAALRRIRLEDLYPSQRKWVDQIRAQVK
jgi:tetratricopeptide (TPR) repeat protein